MKLIKMIIEKTKNLYSSYAESALHKLGSELLALEL
jgi:hypothetical protein